MILIFTLKVEEPGSLILLLFFLSFLFSDRLSFLQILFIPDESLFLSLEIFLDLYNQFSKLLFK